MVEHRAREAHKVGVAGFARLSGLHVTGGFPGRDRAVMASCASSGRAL